MSKVGQAIEKAQRAVGAKADNILRFTCTLSVPGGVENNGDGTFSEGEPATVEGVPCDYGPLSSYERVQAGAVSSGADYQLEFPVVHLGAQLIIPANASVAVNATSLIAGVSFEVVGPLKSDSIWKQRFGATLRS